VEELPRELWFGRTGPLERLSLKRSIAKLEAAGLCPSWSDIEPLLAYLRECVAELGSYARCAAVIGTTRNMIRDACRGRYVPGFDRLLAWGRRLAAHPGGLRGLLLTVDLPVAEVKARRSPADHDPGVMPGVGRRPLDLADYTQGEGAEACLRRRENAAPLEVYALARDNYTQGRSAPRRAWDPRRDGPQSSAMGLPPTIPTRADACPACGCTSLRGVRPPETRDYASFTQGEHAASAHLDAAEAPTLGEVSIPAPKSEAERGVVLISEPVDVGEVSIPAPAPLGEVPHCTHNDDSTLGVDPKYEQQGVGEHTNSEHHPRSGYDHKKHPEKPLRPQLDDPGSVPDMVVAEFRCGGRSTRVGWFDTEEQARRAIDVWLDAKTFEGEPFIAGQPYTRQRTQEQILNELVEKKLEAMIAAQPHEKKDQESLLMTFIFHLIDGVTKHVADNEQRSNGRARVRGGRRRKSSAVPQEGRERVPGP